MSTRRRPTVTTDALRLAAEAGVDPRTSARWLAGSPVRGSLLVERLRRAAADLDLPTAQT